MRVRIVEGEGAPWSGEVWVSPILILINGREYTPLDDLGGIVVEQLDEEEQLLLEEAGFALNLMQ